MDTFNGTMNGTDGGMLWSASSGGWPWQDICKLIMGVMGIVGNTLVIVVYRGEAKQKNSVNVLILALACADLISSIMFLPIPVARVVPNNIWGQIYCRVIFSQAFLWISIEASVYTLTLLSVERYMAVAHPIRYRNIFNGKRPKRFIWVIWLFAVTVKSFNFYNTKIVDGEGCEYISFPKGFNLFLAVGIALVEYFIPIIVMVTCNFFTVKALRGQARKLQSHGPGGGSLNPHSGPAYSVLQTRRRILHIVLIVIATFIICWTPDQISLLLMNLDVLSFQEHFHSNVHQSFVILAFFNSCANPLIYTFKNQHFRASVCELFRCCSNRVSTASDEERATSPHGVGQGRELVNAAVPRRTNVSTVGVSDQPGPLPNSIRTVRGANEESV